MEFLCLGLSHKTAPVRVREKLALPPADAQGLLQALLPHGEVLLLSTCNRVELYAATSGPEALWTAAKEALSRLGGEEALSHLYEHRADAAVVHLFRVAASLDSMVVGEPQILGQLKDSFEFAQKSGTAQGELTRMCAAAFASAKRVRTDTAIGRAAVSMASCGVEMAAKLFGSLKGRRVLLVGAGEMAELSARHLLSAGAQIRITNRTFRRAQEMAQEMAVEAAPFEALSQELVHADVVVTSTASPVPLFTPELLAPLLKQRRHRPLFFLDLAVPRDVDPTVNSLEDVYAYDVDDLQKVLSENAAARAEEAAKAEALVAEEVARFCRTRALREGTPVLAQLRSRAEQIARAEVEKTLGILGEGLTDKQRKSVEAMGISIINKLLHAPTARLREVSVDPEENERLSDAAKELFGLEEALPKKASGGER